MSDTPAVHRFAGDPTEFAFSSTQLHRTPGRQDLPQRPSNPAPSPAAGPSSGSTGRPSDRVELSERGRYMNQMTSMPAIRKDLVEQIRREITSGNYDTTDKLDQAIANLSTELDLFA